MKQESREKIALIVFSITVVVFFVAVIAYMIVAHQWNIAARSIDEHRGSMEGYTVFVYAGDQDSASVQDSGQPDDSSGSSDDVACSEPVSVAQVEASYLSKGAQVMVIDSLDPTEYEGDDIFVVGDKRVGVFYAEEGTSLDQLIVLVEDFCCHDVDFLLCLTDDASFIKHDPSGIDAVLALGDGASLPDEENAGRAHYTVCPDQSSVGVIMLSPDGVVSSKVHSTAPGVEDEEPAE